MIYDIIQFLVGSKTGKRILCLNGDEGSGCCNLAKFAVNYVMDRQFFEDGAVQIDAKNKVSAQGLLFQIARSLNLLTYEIQYLKMAL